MVRESLRVLSAEIAFEVDELARGVEAVDELARGVGAEGVVSGLLGDS